MTPHWGVVCAQNFDTPIWCHHNTPVLTVYEKFSFAHGSELLLSGIAELDQLCLHTQADVKYMDPNSLEFANEPHSCRLIEDHTVQYADLAERRPKFVNMF